MKSNCKNNAYRMFFTLLAAAIFLQPALLSNAAQGDTATLSEADKSAYENLIKKWEDKEWEMYQNAQSAAMQIKLELYQLFMNQGMKSPLEIKPKVISLSRELVDRYVQMLLLRVEMILEIKRDWPDLPVEDWPDLPVEELIEMLQFRPDLILGFTDSIDAMMSIQGLELNWEQEKEISTKWALRNIQGMQKAHEINQIVLDLKIALTKGLPESSWAAEQVAAIAGLQNEIVDYRIQTRKDTWSLLTPDQREKYIHLAVIALKHL